MGIYRVFAGSDGESHIEELRLEEHPELGALTNIHEVPVQQFDGTRKVGIELRRARLASTFPQAPLRSRTVGFPEYGSDPGFPLKVFPTLRKLKRWLAYAPLIAGLPSGSSAQAGSSDSRR